MVTPQTPPLEEEKLSSLQKENILVIDDDPLILKALKRILHSDTIDVLTAKNGFEALGILQNTSLALIICDQRMPGMSGIEVLKEALKIQPEASRIILTASSDLNTVVEAINVGQISQFILKPWDNALLKQTVLTSLEKYKLLKENVLLQELINAQHQALAKTHESLRHELQLGARIHEVLLLGKVPTQVPGIVIDATTIPSKDIDGDFFDFYRPSLQLLDVVIGDVMGKGIPAALVGTAVKTQLMRFAIPYGHVQVFDKKGFWEDDLLSPAEILANVHKELAQQLIQLEFFVSLFYGRFDLQRHKFSFVDCGSTKPLHFQFIQQQIVELSGVNFPLGIVSHDDYQTFEVSFQQGDLFIFYSDGVTETRSFGGELFGVERLKKLVLESHELEASALMINIKNTVLTFAQKETFDDDLTIIVVKIVNGQFPKTAHLKTAKFSCNLAQLKAVRDFVHRFCQQAPGDAQCLTSMLQLAINEAFCNIVKHGYKNNHGGEILLTAELVEEGVIFELSDHGITFDPSQTEEPSLAGDTENGFGLFIIREVADQVTYIHKESETGWNHLRIFKRFIFKEGHMDISHSTEGEILIITPQGESLDAKEAPSFKGKVIDLIAEEHIQHVIFDLHHLHFIDSSGLGSFLSILRVLNTQAGDLKLARMTKPIRSMFELVCMHKIFEIYNTTEDALRSFK